MTFCTKLSLVENLRITLNYLNGFLVVIVEIDIKYYLVLNNIKTFPIGLNLL